MYDALGDPFEFFRLRLVKLIRDNRDKAKACLHGVHWTRNREEIAKVYEVAFTRSIRVLMRDFRAWVGMWCLRTAMGAAVLAGIALIAWQMSK